MKILRRSFWFLCGFVFFFLTSLDRLQAQIVPDNTMPDPSVVNQNNDAVITGGTTAGSNLFHSFEQFSVPTNGSAYFNNATNIQNIFGRVTGGSISNIDGLIEANGTANLFLINPNGVIFGPNAILNIGGSFLASSADSLVFDDGFRFSATNTNTSPLLTINIPIGLQFGNTAASITNRSLAVDSFDFLTGLQVLPGKTLALVGGNVNLDGGALTAPGGRIELGSVASNSFVSLNSIDKGWALGYEKVQNFRDILLSQQAYVDVSDLSSGDVLIRGNRITLTEGSTIFADTFDTGLGGTLEVFASQSLEISDFSSISAWIFEEAMGTGVNIILDTRQLSILDGSQVSTSTLGSGNAGDLTVRESNSVELSGVDDFTTLSSGLGATVQSDATGDGGDLSIVTERLVVRDGAVVITSTFGQGNAGNLTVSDAAEVEVVGSSVAPDGSLISSGLFAQTKATGTGGNLSVSTENLTVLDGGQINATTLGSERAGDLTVRATNIELAGAAFDENRELLTTEFGLPFSSGLFAGTDIDSTGNGGTLTVITDSLRLEDGAAVQTTTFGEGDAGRLVVQATDLIELTGTAKDNPIPTSIVAVSGGVPGLPGVVKASGDGGDLSITTGELIVQDGAQISVSSIGQGIAGNIELTSNSFRLDNGEITARTRSGNGGNLIIGVEDLLLILNESQISTTAGTASSGGNGGDIDIDTQFLAATNNSDITANAFEGNGGNINIDATSIYGIEERRATPPNDTNDIDASSEFGLSGTIEINTPNVDPNRDLVQLPTQPTETEIVQACAPSDTDEQSEFIITGRGGLPPSPEELFDSDAIAVDWVSRQPQNQNSSSEVTNKKIAPEPKPIVEAQGWILNENNEIVLIAHNANNSWQKSPQCQNRSEVRGQRLEGQNRSLLSNNSDRNILIASTQPKFLTAKVPERITVNRFNIKGNTVFDSAELTEVLAPFTNKSLSFAELLQARSAISKYYTDRGYITSGAYLPLQRLEDKKDKVVTIQVVEGYLEEIEITGNKRLNSDYVSSRIETATEDSLQREELLAALQLLQQDSLIASLSAELVAGIRPGASILEVEVNEADSFRTPVLLDNRRAPSVGSFRRQFAINEGNLLGFGDSLFLAYSNTEGSDAFDGSYGFPFNASNGTITVRGGVSSSEVVEEPFNQLNILGDSHYYELSLRQPLVQTPTQEFALGITASRRNSDISSLLDEFNVPPSELSPGADEDGETKVSALSFFQEWTNRNSNQVIAARSQFNLGLGLFDATVNEDAPDSRFFAWQGQAQWTRRLARDTLFLLRGGIQFATTSLLSSEQFGLGGLETLRGYRQDLLLTDNAAFATAEFRLPLFRIRAIESVFQLAPFVDLGAGWNNGGEDRDVTGSNALASVGLGLRLSIFNSFTARFDWGIPLVAVDTEENTWQENGLYFSVEYSPF